jgi:adenine phosphoribosyltransferase
MSDVEYVQQLILDLPDYPKPGIVFKDITPLLADPRGLRTAVALMTAPFEGTGVDLVAGIEARGFLFATPIANVLGAGFVPVRKRGKLPRATLAEEFDLEYGTDTIEVHDDDSLRGKNVLIVDDVLATGGTAAACARLLNRAGASVVGMSFLLEIAPLGGRGLLEVPVHSVLGGDV